MDISSIESFIDHWHRAVAEDVKQDDELADLEALARSLKQAIRSDRAIRRLATSPLLCAVICALHRDTNRQLPKDRIELYERCCAMLLERRGPESGLKLPDYPQLTYRQKRAVLDDLSYWMIKNDWSQVPLQAVQDRFEKKIQTLKDLPPDASAKRILNFFLERSGMLREPIEGELDFAHRTFQEYMAARAAVDEGDVGVLIKNAHNPLWREVITLAAGLARRHERQELIQSVIKKGDQSAVGDRQHLHLLSAACMETGVDLDPTVQRAVRERLEELVGCPRVTFTIEKTSSLYAL